MARRASSGIKPTTLIAFGVGAVALLFGGKVFLNKKQAVSHKDATTLHVQDVLENANSLRGNEYRIDGKVDEKLRWTATQGQVVSVLVGEGASAEPIAIRIPAELSHINVEREQRYSFRVKFEQGGIAVASAIDHL